jgi:hypothetical protein
MQNQQAAQESLLPIAQIPWTETYLFVIILILLVALGYLVRYGMINRPGVGSTSVPQGKQSWMDYGSLFVVLGGLGAVMFGFLLTLLLLGRFGNNGTQALGFLTAYFGAIVGLIGTYFGIKSSGDAAAGAQKLAAANGRDTTEPQVTSHTPADNEKNVSPKIMPTATFSKDMDTVTINEATFKLVAMGGDQADVTPVTPKHPAGVLYDEATKRLRQ